MTLDFIPERIPPTEYPGPPGWLVFFRHRLLVVPGEEEVTFPIFSDPKDLGLSVLEKLYLGRLSGKPCFAAIVSEPGEIPPPLSFTDLRLLYGRMGRERLYLAFRAVHLLDWFQKTKFCKGCGTMLIDHETERAKKMSELRPSQFSPDLPGGDRLGGKGRAMPLGPLSSFPRRILQCIGRLRPTRGNPGRHGSAGDLGRNGYRGAGYPLFRKSTLAVSGFADDRIHRRLRLR